MNKEFTRPDGRKVDEMRNLEVEVGILNRADGSAKAVLGNNIAIASVYGPREMHPKHSSRPDRAKVRLNYRMATFSVKDYKRPFPSRREKEISKVLSEAFESIVLTKMFPRSVVDVHVQIFESDGGTRTAAAIAASAALADAGIPMRDLTGGIASGLYEDMVCLDLNGLEDNVGSGDMPILYSPNIDEISLFQLDGLFTFEQFKQSYNYSLDAIRTIVDTIQTALKQKYVLVRDELALEEDEE
ncbi:MAG: exosome complex exonuclease Rrp41, partial [Candidatus Kariarchaeaceae archaeon]